MSAMGQKQTLRCILVMSALPPKADIAEVTGVSALCQKRTFCAAHRVAGGHQSSTGGTVSPSCSFVGGD